MLTNLAYRKLGIEARLLYIWLCQGKSALVRVWPETAARELNLDLEGCYRALYELAGEGLCYYAEDAPLIWLPDLPFAGNVEGLPRCELLQRALDFYGMPAAAAHALPAIFTDQRARRGGRRQCVFGEACAGKAPSRPGEVKAKLEALADLEKGADRRRAGAGDLINKFNFNTARAEEELKIKNKIKISSSSPRAGQAPEGERDRDAGCGKAAASSPSPSSPAGADGLCGASQEQARDFAEAQRDYAQAVLGENAVLAGAPGPVDKRGNGGLAPGQYLEDLACAHAAKDACLGKCGKAGQEGEEHVPKGGCEYSGTLSLDGSLAEERDRPGESPADLPQELCNYETYRRAGKDFLFRNCQGGEERISAASVSFWREAFPRLDMDLELAGISVWLAGHYGDAFKGGPLPGRLNMENYIANCLRMKAQRDVPGEKAKRGKARRRAPAKCLEEALNHALSGK